MRKKKLLVLTASAWQKPVILAAKAMGLSVVATDKDATAPALALADFPELVDTVDLEAVLRIARKHSVDGVIAEQTDVGVPTAAFVAERMGLPGIGYDTALSVTDKWRMREKCRQNGIAGPEYRQVETLNDALGASEEIGFPVIIKPVDSQASRGVARIQNAADLSKWFGKARNQSRRKSVIIEQLMAGTESSAEALVSNQEIQILGISEKLKCAPPYSYDLRVTYPAAFSPPIIQEIRTLNEKVIKALNLRMGLTHAEFIVTRDGVRLIEIAARGCGAGVATKLIPAMTGLHPIRARIHQALGDDAGLPPRPSNRHGMLEFLRLPRGTITKIEGLNEAQSIPGIVDIGLHLKCGDVSGVVESGEMRPGYVLAVGDSKKEVTGIVRRAKQSLRIEIDGRPGASLDEPLAEAHNA